MRLRVAMLLAAVLSCLLPAFPFGMESRVVLARSAHRALLESAPWIQHQQLVAGDGQSNDYFGVSVSTNADGTYVLVGAGGTSSNAGAAYVFAGNGITWSLQQKLTAGDRTAGDAFGRSVAVSRDAAYALVGAPGKGTNAGAVYVFARSGTTWVQQQELTAGDGQPHDLFGISVSLNGDGSVAMVGADGASSFTGQAYVFTRSGTTWRQEQEITAGDGVAEDAFGFSVTLSNDGTTALVGSSNKASGKGAAYVFAAAGGAWTQQQELTADDGAQADEFGVAVTLSGDGGYALIGADGAAGNIGAVYVFVRNGTSWSQQQKLTASDGAADDFFGNGVSLSDDGSTALVGAYGKGGDTGAGYVFTRTGNSWSQQQELRASNGAASDQFGNSVSLTGDGSTAAVGAYGQASNTGGAYLFTRPFVPRISLSGFPSNIPSGSTFSLTASVTDASGSQTAYVGTVHLASTDAQAVLPVDYTFTQADAGSHTFSVTLNTPVSQTVTVTDVASGATASTSTITVTPRSTTPAPTQGWYLLGGSPLTLWSDASSTWSWDALRGQWRIPQNSEPPGTGAWEYVGTVGNRALSVQNCPYPVGVSVQPHRWNMVGNPCSVQVSVSPGTRILLWTGASYLVGQSIPAGMAAWVLPNASSLSLSPE